MIDITQPINRDDERYDERFAEFMDAILEAFANSPEGKPRDGGDRGVGNWADMFLRYYFDYIGDTLSQATAVEVDEVVFELIPRKVSTEPEAAAEIISELHAFWGFLGREYRLPQARAIQAMLSNESIPKLESLLSDPGNFGMAKSFFMQGRAAGFDMTTQEGLDQFMIAHNAALLANRGVSGFPRDRDMASGYGPRNRGRDAVPDAPLRTFPDNKAKRKARKAQRQARKHNRR